MPGLGYRLGQSNWILITSWVLHTSQGLVSRGFMVGLTHIPREQNAAVLLAQKMSFILQLEFFWMVCSPIKRQLQIQ